MKATTRVHAAITKGNGKANAVLHKAATGAHAGVDRVAGAADHAADWVVEQGKNLKATKERVAADMGEYISEHPWESIGFALAAGYIVGRLRRL